jgi:hypothetical protein
MGEFQPEAHTNGLFGCNLMALIFSSLSATFFSNVVIFEFFIVVG